MPSHNVEVFVKALSRLLGWIYTVCWSLSFYPQPWNNIRRRSTYGLAIDFPTINTLGFICYAVYCLCFLYSPLIRKQYAARNPASPTPSVQFNDLAFAAHAVVLSAIVYSQFFPAIWGFKVAPYQRVSKPIAGLFWGSLLSIVLLIFIILGQSPDGGSDPFSWAWIDLLYAMSYIKVVITVVKYVPQAWLNYKRKSTTGWDIRQILLDLTGGVLSLVQLVLDSSFEADWSGVTGNPIKFLLGNVTVIFDVLFVWQHYVLYKSRTELEEDDDNKDPDVRSSLLSEEDGLPR